MSDIDGNLVLLVEDDDNDVLLIRRALRKSGVAAGVQVASDGEIAVNYLSGHGDYADRVHYPMPTVVLLDLKLPRKSGLEVLAWIRQQPDLKRLPIVVLTSSRESRDVSGAYDLGANSYLVKPVSPDAVLELIQTLGLYWLTFNEKPQLEYG